jgi:predicted nucleic acid-binding protein
LDHHDAPEKINITIKLWEQLKNNKYEVYISYLTLEEINQCSEQKRETLLKYLSEIEFKLIESITIEADSITNEIIKQGILTERSRDDCTHIALAVINDCDIIVSWNFRHMVNVRTINGIRGINLMNGYKAIDIYPPNTLIGDE